MTSLVLALYQLIAFFSSLCALLVAPFWPRARKRLAERFGWWGKAPTGLDTCLWLHGASLGEMQGLEPVALALRRRSELPILTTAATTTGAERAERWSALARLVPMECLLWYRAALDRYTPRALVISETEIWIGMLAYAKARRIPTLMINARISDYTFQTYHLFRFLVAPWLRTLRAILTISEEDRSRFIALGATPERVFCVGNSKYDHGADPSTVKPLRLFSTQRPLLTIGCLRPGEELITFPALKSACLDRWNVIIAPRHLEKCDLFCSVLERFEIPYIRRSMLTGPTPHAVVVLDTLGELTNAYAASQAAIIGGTLADYGGHNPLEAAQFGVALGMGPYAKNIRDVEARLEQFSARVMLRSSDDLSAWLKSSAEELSASGRRAKEVSDSLRGATGRIVDHILREIA